MTMVHGHTLSATPMPVNASLVVVGDRLNPKLPPACLEWWMNVNATNGLPPLQGLNLL
jgi:hypothetical protein